MAIKGGAMRVSMMTCYFIIFCCSMIITGAFAWFTATQIRARNIAPLVLGIASALWSSTGFLLICLTAGISFFAIPRIVTDLIFAAVMIAIAALNRSATNGCSSSPYPRVVSSGGSVGSGCRLFVAAFAVSIIGILMYIVTAAIQTLIWRRGRKSDPSSSRV